MFTQPKNWFVGLMVSTALTGSAITLEQPEVTKPSSDTVMEKVETNGTGLTPTNAELEVARGRAAQVRDFFRGAFACCMVATEELNTTLNQAAVTSLLLSQNVSAYDNLLNQGLNKDNIMKFQDQIKQILGVTQLNKETLAMIQQVIAIHPLPGTLTNTVSPVDGTQLLVTRNLLTTGRHDFEVMLDQGMTAQNFTKGEYVANIMDTAGVADTAENRKFVKNVIKAHPKKGIMQ